MVDVMCAEAMRLLTTAFAEPFILNDGHDIFARLEAGDDIADIVEDYSRKLGQPAMAREIRQVTENWPPLHLSAVANMVQWALGKLDTDDRVTIRWKGDADHPDTVTRFELRDHELLVEFAHPPGGLTAARGSA